jgi:uncharacterized protein with NRDE domain
MCLIAFALHAHPRYRLVLAGNRDEFHARPSAPAEFHPDDARVYGGRDLRAGGSWLSLSRRGRVVAVTNVRVGQPETGARSRGELVHRLVRSDATLDRDIAQLHKEADTFGRFNLLAFDGSAMQVMGNHPGFFASRVDAGVHAISNAGLNTPWPKTLALRSVLARWTEAGDDDPQPLLQALQNTDVADDAELPDTGIGLALERLLSSAFIRGRDYGTRASTIVLVDDRSLRCIEQRFGPDGVPEGSSDVHIEIG